MSEKPMTISAIQEMAIKYGKKPFAVQNHMELMQRGFDYENAIGRDPLAHFMEEVGEVSTFVSRSNAIEEIGDLIFTAIHYVNDELEADDRQKITLLEILAVNAAKLAVPKNLPGSVENEVVIPRFITDSQELVS